MAVSHVFSSPVADFTGTVTVFDSNGNTATTNATALVRPSNWNSVHNQFMTISGNTSGASTASGTNLVLQGGNNVTLSVTDQTIIFSASQSQSVQTQNMVSILGSTGNISFANGNGVTFGGNASNVTASHNGLTSQSNQAFSAAGGSSAFQTLVFADSQGVSWSNSNGSVVATVKTDYAASNHSHGNPTLNLTNLSGTTDSNSAGFTLSLSAANAGAFSAGISGGNTSGDTGTVSNRIVFAGGNNITVSGSTNAGGMSVTISGPNAGGAQTGISGIIVSDTTYTSGTVSFSNANGITFGSSAGQAITASHNGLTSQSNQAVSAANGSYAFQTLSFSNANGVSFGTSAGSAITASYTVPTVTNSSWTVSDAATSATVGRLAFTNSNGLTLSLSTSNNGNHTVIGSYTVPTITSWTVSDSATSATVGRLAFTASNGLTLTLSTSNNGNHTVIGSYTRPVVSNAIQSVGSATGSGTNTSRFAADDHVHAGVFSMGVSTGGNTSGNTRVDVGQFVLVGGNNITLSQGTAANGLNTITISAGAGGGVNPVASASNGSFSFTTLNFSNANNVTFGTSAGSIITASVAAPGAAAEQNAINLLGANTAGNTTATGSTIGLSGINLTLSGTNNSVVNISAPATSSLVGVLPISISTNGSTVSVSYVQSYQSFFAALLPGMSTAVSQVGNGTIAVYPVLREGAFTATRGDIWASMSVSSSSNSSHAGALSIHIGIYTRNGSTLSLASSGSQSYQWTNTSNNSLGSIASLRQLSVPIDVNYSDGKDLWVAVMTRSSTTNANWFTGSNVLQSYNAHSAQLIGLIGEASNATRGPLGLGRFSASSSVLPASMGFTQITGGMGGTASASRLMPNVFFQNFTA